MSASVKLHRPPSETALKLPRFRFDGELWPTPSPISAVYDVCNSSTRLIILNNKLSTKREGSRLRGQTVVKGVFDRPQPDRHFLDSPQSARERHKHCIISESDLFVPIFPPSIPYPPVWVKKSKIRDVSSTHSKHHTARSFDKDIKRLFDEISRPQKIFTRRETRLSPTMKSLVDDSHLPRGERQYLANIAKVYSLDEMRQQKMHQLNQLIYQELCKGSYSSKEITKYHSYFSSQPRNQNIRIEVKSTSSSPHNSKTRSTFGGKERRPQTVQPNERSQKQARTSSCFSTSRTKSSHGENQPITRCRKSTDQANVVQSDESESKILAREYKLNATEDEHYDFRHQSPQSKSSPRQNKSKDTLREEKFNKNDDEYNSVSPPGKEQNKILISLSEDGSLSESEVTGDREVEKQKKGKTYNDTELLVAEKEQVLIGETILGHTEIKEDNFDTQVVEVDNYDNHDDEITNDHDNVDAGDKSSVDSSIEESDTSESDGGKNAFNEELLLNDSDTNTKQADQLENLTETGREKETHLKTESSGEIEPQDCVAKGEMAEILSHSPELIEGYLDQTLDKADAFNEELLLNDSDTNTKQSDQLKNLAVTGREKETHLKTESSGEIEPQDCVAKGEMAEILSHSQELIKGDLDQTLDKADDNQSVVTVNADTEADTKDEREPSDHGHSDKLSNDSLNEVDISSSCYESEKDDGKKEDLNNKKDSSSDETSNSQTFN
ncbi:unnamed protein product [Lymnaea stagnalis]|uniref:Uncharacterized protein n=1 Tax=Lymnaea stagnalis TaxID=6523 RepID=A0AAV2HRK8_LYMST